MSRINLKRYLFLAILLLLVTSVSIAQDDTAMELANQEMKMKPDRDQLTEDQIFDQRISLDLNDIGVVEAFKYLASKAGLNVITSKAVAGRVTLSLDNVRIRDVFDILLRSNKLAYVKQGNIYSVMSEAEYKTLYGESFYDMRQVKVFRLRYAIPEQIFNLLNVMKSEIGRVIVDPESGSVFILDNPEKIKQVEQALIEFDRQDLVKIFTLKYARAKDIEDILKTRLDLKEVGTIKADERNNQVIVQTFPARMKEMEILIKSLDKQTKEVLIDAKIVKIKLSDRLDRGVEWEGLFALARDQGRGSAMSYLGSYPFSAVQSATDDWRSRMDVVKDMGESVGSYPFSGFTSDYASSNKRVLGENVHLGVVDDSKDLDVLIDLMQTLGETRIISNPKIVIVNNQEAKIHVGEKQAYVTTTTTTGQATSTLAEEVSFVDIGIQLSVTPHISDNGFITMKVRPEVSSVSSFMTTPTNNQIPIVDTSVTETTVMVKNGNTVIIGGMRKEEEMTADEQVPILGSLPIFGLLFKTGYSKVERTELVVLLTPHILTGMELFTADNTEIAPHLVGKEYREYANITIEGELFAEDRTPKMEHKPLRSVNDVSSGKEVKIKGERYEP